MQLILASTSSYRRALLSRLGTPFDCAKIVVDETPTRNEPPADLAFRLAADKAHAGLALHPGACVIGSDQAADLDGEPLGKPGTREAAIDQLRRMSGQPVRFHTAVAVATQDRMLQMADCTTVRFRTLTSGEIARYVDLESPLDCAGSFKCEGLGISLFDAIETQDPTALIGLPLIGVACLLRQVGFQVP
ncbi:MAG: nucleoside triphosphate pyrophosphatase [Pseudoxanthomonas sp.]